MCLIEYWFPHGHFGGGSSSDKSFSNDCLLQTNAHIRLVLDGVSRVQIMDEAFCIFHSINTLRKGMNPTIILPAIGKIVR